jgi:DNA-binding NtrC family response regulator
MLLWLVSKTRSILVVDDEIDIINSVKRWLEADGFKVHGIADPLQALEYFENNSDDIDIVLSDIRMRKIDGRDLVKRIKTIRPETKIILMTALETDRLELSETLPSIKIDGFMTKPGSLQKSANDLNKIE